MIDCLEFRRQALASPDALSAPLALHLSECPECQHYYQGLMAQEQALKAVLAVDVPEGLAAEVRLKQRFSERSGGLGKRLKRWWPLALVASLLLALIWAPLPGDDQRLAREVLAHIEEDRAAWLVQPGAAEQLPGALQRVNLNLQAGEPLQVLGQLSFAGNCVIDGKLAVHLVLRTSAGPVTLLLMPDQQVQGALTLVQEQWQASLEPLAQGSLAIIAKPGMDIAPFRQQLRQQVKPLLL